VAPSPSPAPPSKVTCKLSQSRYQFSKYIKSSIPSQIVQKIFIAMHIII
jgi:hypothetical protein